VIDKEYSTALFRVFQESLTNIARHSEAEKVEIALRKTKGELVLVLYDNGKGIRESDVSNGASLGVLGMRERLRPFGGHLLITGKPGMGTRVTVRIPLPGRAAKNRKGT
jgi:signal transduction histidine kinase